MPLAPNDLEHLIRGDHQLGNMLFQRLESPTANRHAVLAQIVFGLATHGGAAQSVLFPALREHLPDGDAQADALQDRLNKVKEALVIVADDDEADAPVNNALDSIKAELGVIVPTVDDRLLPELRTKVGDAGMVQLGNEFVTAKRHAPTRAHPHAPTQSTLSKVGGFFASFIDKARDSLHEHDLFVATDASGLLDPQAQDIVDSLATLNPKPVEILEPSQARRQPTASDAVTQLYKLRDQEPPVIEITSVREHMIPGAKGDLMIRVYDNLPLNHEPAPVVIYVHGGGWVLADLDVYDGSARAIAAQSDAVVVSVEYRHAPEDPFPAAHEDVLAATRWVLANAATLQGDADRVAMVGESAGGNMVASTVNTLHSVGTGGIVAQVLVYPVTSASEDWPSFAEAQDARPLNTAMMGWFTTHAFPNLDLAQDHRFDLLSIDASQLRNVPPALVITAERDPLRDQGKAYADLLASAGVDVQLRHYEGVPHEFFGMGPALDKSLDAQALAARFLRSHFGTAGDVVTTDETYRLRAEATGT